MSRTDLIAMPADLLLVNPNELSQQEKESLAEFYKEIEPAEVSLILTEDCKEFEQIKKVYGKEDI